MDPLDSLYIDTVLSAESIRENVDDYTLFCYYMNDEPIINEPVLSPLRTDSKPSFNLYYNKRGILRFRDHGSGLDGDIFDFISRLYNIRFGDALQQINKDFGLGYNGCPSVEVKYSRRTPRSKSKKELAITSKCFTPKALQWWNEFHINKATLLRYNVSQVEWLHWDGVPTKAGEFAFAYRIGKYYKIYRPFAVLCNKFLNNYPRNYVEGIFQLKYASDTLIITKSLKDVMVLDVLGYEAVSPKSESTSIHQRVRDVLNKQYKRIVVLFDDDEGGHNGVNYYPEYEKLFIKEEQKDISDFVRSNGLKEAKSLIQSLLNS